MDKTRDPTQVRDAILRVFREMTSSPHGHGGPAIVVGRKTPTIAKTGGVKTAAETFRKYELYDSDDVMISDGAATCTPEKQIAKPKKDTKKSQKAAKHADDEPRKEHSHLRSLSHKTHHQKEKRRKSRAERNKRRVHQKQQQVDPHEKAEFRKHVRRAKEISSHSRIDKALLEARPYSAITQCRLTRPVGIYNKGKKSDKVYRAPIQVSDRVKEAVDRDLKKILSSSPATTLHCTPSYESLLTDRGGTPVFSTVKRKSQASSVRSAPRSHSSFANDDVMTASLDKELPKEPPIAEIAANLMASLDLKAVFPDRDYFEEVQGDLLRLMKQNRPHAGGDHSPTAFHTSGLDALLTRNAEDKNQPSAVLLSTGSVQPHEESQTYIAHSHQRSEPHPEPHPGPHPDPYQRDAVHSLSQTLQEPRPHPIPHPVPHPGPHPDPYQRDAVHSLSQTLQEPRPHPIPHPGPHSGPHPGDAVYSLSQESDGLDLRQYHHHQETMPTHLVSSAPSSYQTAYVPDVHKRALDSITNGLELLKRDEELQQARHSSRERLADKRLTSRHDISQLDRRTDYQAAYQQDHSSSDILDLIGNSHQLLSSESYSQDSILPFSSSYSQERLHELNYNPTQDRLDDGLYFGSQHHFHDDYSWVAQPDHQRSSRDYVQVDPRVRGFLSEKELLWRQWSGRFKRGRDSDDDSLIWYPTHVSPLQKPRLESPSPPKQYPQRMF